MENPDDRLVIAAREMGKAAEELEQELIKPKPQKEPGTLLSLLRKIKHPKSVLVGLVGAAIVGNYFIDEEMEPFSPIEIKDTRDYCRRLLQFGRYDNDVQFETLTKDSYPGEKGDLEIIENGHNGLNRILHREKNEATDPALQKKGGIYPFVECLTTSPNSTEKKGCDEILSGKETTPFTGAFGVGLIPEGDKEALKKQLAYYKILRHDGVSKGMEEANTLIEHPLGMWWHGEDYREALNSVTLTCGTLLSAEVRSLHQSGFTPEEMLNWLGTGKIFQNESPERLKSIKAWGLEPPLEWIEHFEGLKKVKDMSQFKNLASRVKLKLEKEEYFKMDSFLKLYLERESDPSFLHFMKAIEKRPDINLIEAIRYSPQKINEKALKGMVEMLEQGGAWSELKWLLEKLGDVDYKRDALTIQKMGNSEYLKWAIQFEKAGLRLSTFFTIMEEEDIKNTIAMKRLLELFQRGYKYHQTYEANDFFKANIWKMIQNDTTFRFLLKSIQEGRTGEEYESYVSLIVGEEKKSWKIVARFQLMGKIDPILHHLTSGKWDNEVKLLDSLLKIYGSKKYNPELLPILGSPKFLEDMHHLKQWCGNKLDQYEGDDFTPHFNETIEALIDTGLYADERFIAKLYALYGSDLGWRITGAVIRKANADMSIEELIILANRLDAQKEERERTAEALEKKLKQKEGKNEEEKSERDAESRRNREEWGN